MPQGELGIIEVREHFTGGPVDGGTVNASGGFIGQVGYASVNEGSLAMTVDEPGGILAATTDTGDNDNFALWAGPFKPADGGMIMEVRFKYSNVDCAIWTGFTETLSLATPVMPSEFATATMTYNGTGGLVGIQYDVDGTTDDFRAVMGDGGAATASAGNGTRANATVTADKWFIARIEVDPDGTARVYFGHSGLASNQGLQLVKTYAAGGITTTDVFHAALMIENRSANARILETDYFFAKGYVDWTS